MKLSSSRDLSLFLVIRLSSVFVVQTWFVPDEYWQSLEVAHKLTFDFGFLTWEWYEGIRSLVYPIMISITYKLLAYFCLDVRIALIYAPRILQSLVSAWSEWIFTKQIGKILSPAQVLWFTLLQLGSYFMYYVGSRTLANTLEMNLAMMGIAFFLNRQRGIFLFIVIISFYMRPTSAPLWLPFVLHFVQKELKWLFSSSGLKVSTRCLLALGFIACLDSLWYGKPTIVPIHFVLFNFVNDFSQFYGEHPWHWYFTNALPSLMGPTIVPLILTLQLVKSNVMKERTILTILLSVALYILCHTFVGHKEIRFLTPAVPLLNVLASLNLPNWKWRKGFLILFLVWNIPITVYLSIRHQRGVLDATTFIGSWISPNDQVLYLMPCHSTPLYSHLHVNATLKFLTCPPNLSYEKNYVDEADRFYDNPAKWLQENPHYAKFNYFVFFDPLLDVISAHLNANRYRLIGNFFHADIVQGRVGRRVLVYKRE